MSTRRSWRTEIIEWTIALFIGIAAWQLLDELTSPSSLSLGLRQLLTYGIVVGAFFAVVEITHPRPRYRGCTSGGVGTGDHSQSVAGCRAWSANSRRGVAERALVTPALRADDYAAHQEEVGRAQGLAEAGTRDVRRTRRRRAVMAAPELNRFWGTLVALGFIFLIVAPIGNQLIAAASGLAFLALLPIAALAVRTGFEEGVEYARKNLQPEKVNIDKLQEVIDRADSAFERGYWHGFAAVYIEREKP